MDINYKKNGVRFALPAHDTLISWINQKNQRNFTKDDFLFEDPVFKDHDGWVYISGKFLPTDQAFKLEVQRVDLSKLTGLSVLTIHAKSFTKASIAEAIFKQYGIYLDLDLFDLDLNKQNISQILGNSLNGFEEGSNPDSLPVGLDDTDGIIVISHKHPTLEGTIPFKIRMAMLSFEYQIDPILSLREFYSVSDEHKAYVETIQPNGLWTVDKGFFPNYLLKKETDTRLYGMTLPNSVIDYDYIASLLSIITKQKWVSSNIPSPFNVMGTTIKYNGVSGKYPNIAPIEYSYLMIMELGDLCTNLQGNIHLAYQYINDKHPMYGKKTLAGTQPL